jgi:16S rRNA processing protein RimM
MLVGEVLKVFGTGGELIANIRESVSEESKEPIFIRIDGLWVPFFFKLFELQGRRVKIIFENMESEELAGELVGKKMYSQPETVLESAVGLSALTGFTVVDTALGTLGQVEEFFDYPGNPCIEVTVNEKQILIPINGVNKLDYRRKIIHTTIPEGLLEL